MRGRHRGALTWVLIGLMVLLAAGAAQRQTVGVPHVHAPPGGHGHEHGPGHGHPHPHPHPSAHGPEPGHGDEHAHTPLVQRLHQHLHWLQHWHAPGDPSVQALDAAQDTTGSTLSPSTAAMPFWCVPASGLRTFAAGLMREDWPRARAARISRWGTAPPLRPPRA